VLTTCADFIGISMSSRPIWFHCSSWVCWCIFKCMASGWHQFRDCRCLCVWSRSGVTIWVLQYHLSQALCLDPGKC